MTTTTDNVVMGETSVSSDADSQTADSSQAADNATGGDTSDGSDGKYVPMDRFKEVISQRNGERGEFKKLRQEHDQLLGWVHSEVVPALEKMKGAGDTAMTEVAEDVYQDPLESRIDAQRAEIDALKQQVSKDKQDSFSRSFTEKIDVLCGKFELASGAEIVDAYLRNPSQNFDFEAAAKRSHEMHERKADVWGKKRVAAASAKKLNDPSPAQLAAANPPRNMDQARKMVRAHFQNK